MATATERLAALEAEVARLRRRVPLREQVADQIATLIANIADSDSIDLSSIRMSPDNTGPMNGKYAQVSFTLKDSDGLPHGVMINVYCDSDTDQAMLTGHTSGSARMLNRPGIRVNLSADETWNG